MATHTVFGTDDVSHAACCHYIPRPAQKRPLLQGVLSNAGPKATLYRSEVMKTIEDEIDRVTEELRDLNRVIWENPELRYEEKEAHDVLTAFMADQGFEVTKHYKSDEVMTTAWRAEFAYKADIGATRTLGVNSEMDALPVPFDGREVSHACGHNLIAVAGVAVAIAVKKALQVHDLPGKVVLLGTPAEESGQGKVRLLDAGAYEGMDACVMMHPGSGPDDTIATNGNLANQAVEVTYHGKTAHAAVAPWQGINAQDAVMLSYTAVSMLRQQLHPDLRVHGIVRYRDDPKPAPNVIPSELSFIWNIRAPNVVDLKELRERVIACIEGAALATGCKAIITEKTPNLNLRQNSALAREFAETAVNYLGLNFIDIEEAGPYSTDFGNVTHEVPGIHPVYTVINDPNGSPHTSAFTGYAGPHHHEAHNKTMTVAKALAFAGFRVLDDDEFFEQVKAAFEEQDDVSPKA